MTLDPVIEVNRYAYADNNPVNLVDDIGLANTLEEGGSAIEKCKPKTNPNKMPIIETKGKVGVGLEAKSKIMGVSFEVGGVKYIEGLTSNSPMETIEFDG